jgi:hypothetical protein
MSREAAIRCPCLRSLRSTKYAMSKNGTSGVSYVGRNAASLCPAAPSRSSSFARGRLCCTYRHFSTRRVPLHRPDTPNGTHTGRGSRTICGRADPRCCLIQRGRTDRAHGRGTPRSTCARPLARRRCASADRRSGLLSVVRTGGHHRLPPRPT